MLTIFWIVSLLFVQAAPFIPNEFLQHVPFYVVPTLGTSLLAIGTVYWLVWAKVLPAFGYDIQHEVVQMPDGSERVKYKVSTSTRRPCVLGTKARLADLEIAEGQTQEAEKAGSVESATEAICLVTRAMRVGGGVRSFDDFAEKPCMSSIPTPD
jgi:hypothetical protein